MRKSRIICLNPWDSQSKQIISPNGIGGSLCAGEQRWGSVPPNIIIDRHANNPCTATEAGKEYRMDGNEK